MTTEDAIKAEMRLNALEALVMMLWAYNHLSQPDPKASLETLERNLLEKARAQTFPQIGAAYSDLAAAELEAAVASAMKRQRDFLRPRLEED